MRLFLDESREISGRALWGARVVAAYFVLNALWLGGVAAPYTTAGGLLGAGFVYWAALRLLSKPAEVSEGEGGNAG